MLDLEAHAQFGNVNLCSVIEAGVQSLQHRLGGQVQLGERQQGSDHSACWKDSLERPLPHPGPPSVPPSALPTGDHLATQTPPPSPPPQGDLFQTNR